MKVFVINLERSVPRRRYMQRQFEHIGPSLDFDFVKATDIEDLNEDWMSSNVEPELLLEVRSHRNISLATFACTDSHRRVYEKILTIGRPGDFFLVLEDDATLDYDFFRSLPCLEVMLREQAVDFAMLYFSVGKKTALGPQKGLSKELGSALYAMPEKVASAVAYVIEFSTARRLLIHQTPRLRTVVDSFASLRDLGALKNPCVIYPMPVTTGFFLSSMEYKLSSSNLRRLVKALFMRLPGLRRIAMSRHKNYIDQSGSV